MSEELLIFFPYASGYYLLFSNLSVSDYSELNLAPFHFHGGCQDFIGSIPSVFLDKNNFLKNEPQM